jgi:putative ABC transport system permease protein
MSLLNYITISFKALIQNKVRTLLTLLGIVIGIGSVISLMAISNGATSSITGELSSLGTNTVTLSPGSSNSNGGPRPPGGGAANALLENDVLNELENKLTTNSYNDILPTRSSTETISYKDVERTQSILGISTKYFVYNEVTISEGRKLTESEIEKGAPLVILPKSESDKLFKSENPLGKSILIKNQEFEVVGVSEASGIGQSSIVTSINQVQENLVSNDDFSSIAINAKDNQANNVKSQIESILCKFYDVDVDDANFSVTTSESLLESVNTITATLSALLVAIGGISLLVGGIGIMNIMLVTVTERTKEIGLRKAVGAKIQDILIQFLTEAIIITLIGGLLGILLGWAVSLIATYGFNFPAPLTLDSILLAVGVSSAIGVIFGFYPAYKASKLQPIVALKSE